MATNETPRRRHSYAGPDIMNDAAYATNSNHIKSQDEPDTCRICRSEGTKEEPLFYPCKCSGSIKFVHQNCLMEWLSHSQKKHCELCKTPFRFTKLYHPQMPPDLPTSVFLRRAALHVVQGLLTWSRALLVFVIWLVWLPWSMRCVWTAVFWFVDGALARDSYLNLFWKAAADTSELDHLNITQWGTDASFISEARKLAHAPPVNESGLTIPEFLQWQSQTLNMSAGEPLGMSLIKTVLGKLFLATTDTANHPAEMGNFTVSQEMKRLKRSSLLSNVSMLNNLTSSAGMNKFIVDTMEGQIITLSVVVAFILVFLIREWVVQQQPVLNLDPVNVAQANNPAAPAVELQHLLDAVEHEEDTSSDEWSNESEDGSSSTEESHEPGMETQSDQQGPPMIDESAPPSSPPRQASHESSTEGTSSELPNLIEAYNDDTRRGRPQEIMERHVRSASIRLLQNSLPDDERDTFERAFNQSVSEAAESLPIDVLSRVIMLSREREQAMKLGDDQDTEVERLLVDILANLARVPTPVYRGLVRIRLDAAHTGEESTTPLDSKAAHDKTPGGAPSDVSLAKITRPAMPARSSSKATDIRRRLEESVKASEMERQDLEEDEENVERNSDDSTDSWIPVTAIPEESERPAEKAVDYFQQRSEASPTRDEGKAKAVPETSGIDVSESWEDAPEELEGQPRPAELLFDASSISPEHPSDSRSAAPMSGLDGSDSTDTAQSSLAAPMPAAATNIVPPDAQPQPKSLSDRVADWLWGDFDQDVRGVAPQEEAEPDADDGHVVENIEDEEPFVPVGAGLQEPEQDVGAANDGNAMDPDVAAAALQAGIDVNDQDAMIDDAEDLEGVLELIGMQGPLVALVQNAIFGSILVSATIFGAIGIPYLFGKFVFLAIGNPVSLLFRIPFTLAIGSVELGVDTLLLVGSSFLYYIVQLANSVQLLSKFVYPLPDFFDSTFLAVTFRGFATRAFERISTSFLALAMAPSFDLLQLSYRAHESLHELKADIASVVRVFTYVFSYIREGGVSSAAAPASLRSTSFSKGLYATIEHLRLLIGALLDRTQALYLGASFADPQSQQEFLDPTLVYWSTTDRIITIAAGYGFLATLGLWYVSRENPFTSSEKGKKVERVIKDILIQAGGVMKVILIISIEMLIFPLYCGLLLDLALLPLFSGATVASRINFAVTSPITAAFTHWFIGTCYMFHFALFVSMCRKVMRSGVLYFIRDPDDPTFHPVRDVLERSVTLQLKKITFSALVYGGLVLVCLGGIVWGLYYGFGSVLPIRWASNDPIFSFPIDILCYNLLIPVILKAIKPSTNLHKMYSWWFRKCARMLRLSDFLFGEKYNDEEGHHVRKTWSAWLRQKKGDVNEPVIGEDRRILMEDRNVEVYFLRDGRYVRAPNQDSVRVPKGEAVFLEVSERDKPLDGDKATSAHFNYPNYTQVYIPPWFRVRIAAFVGCLWLFAAATGVGTTILPLLFGRTVFSLITPDGVYINDIHALSLGLYTVSGIIYVGLKWRRIRRRLHSLRAKAHPSTSGIFTEATVIVARTLKVIYLYTTFALVIPLLFSTCWELYFMLPLHRFLAGNEETHYINLVQDLVLGIMYMRIALGAIHSLPDSRMHRALHAIVQKGWLNPDAELATRGFILPLALVFTLALGVPFGVGTVAACFTEDQASKTLAYNYAYPGVLGCVLTVYFAYQTNKAARRWRLRIRDEVYLIGERLHNYNERRERRPGGRLRRVSGLVL